MLSASCGALELSSLERRYMSIAGPASSTGSHQLHPHRQSGQTLPIRMDLAEYVPMTAEQRDRALNALASLLAATWTDDNNAVDLGAV